MNLRKGAVPRQTGVLGPLPILDTSIQAWRGAGDPTDHLHSRCHCHPSLLLPTPPAASVPPPPPPPLQIKSPAWTSAPTPLLLLHSSTAQCGTLAVATLALILLLLSPALAWYKPAAGPHHYSVGRASGLLSTFHRFPSTRRSESPALPAGTGTGPLRLEMRSSLRSLALCVKDVTPNLQSCQPQFNSPGTFQCQADVSLSLREEAECQRPEP